MKLPRYLLRTLLSVETYGGESATGPIFGTAHPVRCHFEGGRRLVYGSDQGSRDSIATGTAFVNDDSLFTLGSKVTKGSKVYIVVDVIENDTGLPNSPDHYEILLSPYRMTGSRN